MIQQFVVMNQDYEKPEELLQLGFDSKQNKLHGEIFGIEKQ